MTTAQQTPPVRPGTAAQPDTGSHEMTEQYAQQASFPWWKRALLTMIDTARPQTAARMLPPWSDPYNVAGSQR